MDKVFAHQSLTLNDMQLETLKDITRNGLPGTAGEQAAEIVGNYYKFLGAEREFNDIYKAEYTEGSDTHNSLNDFEAQHEELRALRTLYLGDDAAKSLYAISDANASYMFASKKLQADPSIDAKTKAIRQAELVKRHTSSTIGVDNWDERHLAFLEDKRQLENAALSFEDKQRELNALLKSHFSFTEHQAIAHLSLDVF